MKQVVTVIMLVLSLSLAACDGGGKGGAKPGQGGGPGGGGGDDHGGGDTPTPAVAQDCGAEISQTCTLFGLKTEEVNEVRKDVVHAVTPDMTLENYSEQDLVVARVYILHDFIRTWYPHAVVKVTPENQDDVVNFFLSIKWD